MHGLRRMLVAGTAIALAGAVGIVAPAGARGASVGVSRYGAGYFSQVSSLPTVTVTFKAPIVTCASAADEETLAPGLALIDNVGRVTSVVVLAAECNLGVVSYTTRVCLASQICATGVAEPGDTLVATIVRSGGEVDGSLRDKRSGVIVTDTELTNSLDLYTFVGAISPHWIDNTEPVATFSSVKFTHARVNGQPQGAVYMDRLNLQGASDVQIKVGKIAPKGSTFTDKFVANV